jgi:hypothetical protein
MQREDMSEKGEFTKQMEERIRDRATEDLTVVHNCDAAYIYHPVGASLDEIEPFTTELTSVVDKMKEELVNETRILEGTDVPEYKENELSQSKPTDEQWTSDSQNGSSTIDLIPTSTLASDSLSAFVGLLNQDSPGDISRESFMRAFNVSCSVRSGGCGIEIDATNESCECTVPTISEPTDGMQSEEK